MSPQVQQVQRDFSVGIVMDTGPESIDPRALRDHVNGFYEEDATAYKRGGSVAHSDALADPEDHPFSWIFDGYFDAGHRTICASRDNFYVLAVDDESFLNLGSDGMVLPKSSALVESMLFIGGGYIYGGSRKTADYSTGTVAFTKVEYDDVGEPTNETAAKTVTGSGTSFTANIDPGMLIQRASERLYVVASVDSDTQLTLRDPYEGASGTGLAYTATPFYKITIGDPYEDGEFYAVAQNRLITAQGSKLLFTEIEDPGKWTLTAGDPTGEIPNEHHLPEGIRITGVGVIGATVLILTTGGIWTLEGIAFDIVDSSGNTNHRVRVLSRELVSYGQVATWEQALVIPCLSGIFLVDGVSAPRRISHPLDQLYQIYMERTYLPGQPAVFRDHLLLPLITLAGEVMDILAARLDRPVKVSGQTAFPWSRLGGTGVECPAFTVRHTVSPQPPKLLGANKPLAQILDCSGFFDPDESNTLDADGEAPEWVLVTRDYETGNLTKNTVRTIRPRYELIGEDAEITVEYGFGATETGGYTWDEFNWSHDSDDETEDLYWEDDEDDIYQPLSCGFTESDGSDPTHCRVNEETRLIRYRFRNATPCSHLRFRSLEQHIRQSNAIRR